MTHAYKDSVLPPPSLAHNAHKGIGLHAAANLLIRIDPSPDMDEGDLLELFWDDCYVTSHPLTAAEVGKPVFLSIPESFPDSTTARIHYRLMKTGRCPRISCALPVLIKLDCPGGPPIHPDDEENQALAPVVLPTALRRQGVSAPQLRSGVPFAIEPYLNMAPDDEITLRWGDVRLDLPVLKAGNVGKMVRGRVPAASILEAGEDDHLEISYCIIDRVGNSSRWSPPLRLKVFGLDRRHA
ncbi:hypothetical protein [Pseudomonas akapageensis]|uniref:hypothetical protein n=1 Tax=Pseudomonas akapageensis TaxID=2609961 RepID=UPI00140CC067|nr:hypothetical protein [Pseudomonas akapageensis]